MLALYIVFMALWVWRSHGFQSSAAGRPGTDFVVFWAASHVMLNTHAWQVYDYPAFAAIERSLFHDLPKNAFLPWLYPPAFLVLVTPLALLPFTPSYLVFCALSLAVFVPAALRVSGLTPDALASKTAVLFLVASPFVPVALIFGQNALLTAALAALAVYWIDRHPVRAGMCLGLLTIKPQMAMLFPIVLLASRAWRPFLAAAASAAAVTLASTLICGMNAVKLFVANAGMARELVLEHDSQFWLASPAPFALFRTAGLSVPLAWIAQGAATTIAICVACHVWRRTRDVGLRAAALCAATLIANPYVWHYELAWLGVAVACLVASGLREGWQAGEQQVLTLAWLLPLYELFNRWLAWPQIGPLVVMLVLLITLRRVNLVQGERS
ncbi:DUF2029 domain-containing protein [Paraburkholderia pallida]|uniref:DUF2029 domain-containing protein n=2 Tax=Paraburkholderia pallida TaxID=2547399 RepID=A0A4P7CWY8_9BURK|nr:DUF2029 domain-containing protein [Paraburkholderia pallida]